MKSLGISLRITCTLFGAVTLGFKQKKHQDWFDDNDLEINELLDEKHRQHLLVLNASAADKKSSTKEV